MDLSCNYEIVLLVILKNYLKWEYSVIASGFHSFLFLNCRTAVNMLSMRGCRVWGKISDLSKIADSDFLKFLTPTFPKFPTLTPNSLTWTQWNVAVKINGNHGAQEEISISTKVSKEIVPFQQEFAIKCDVKNDPIGHPESELDKNDFDSQC